jgi:hypothetical protein
VLSAPVASTSAGAVRPAPLTTGTGTGAAKPPLPQAAASANPGGMPATTRKATGAQVAEDRMES